MSVRQCAARGLPNANAAAGATTQAAYSRTRRPAAFRLAAWVSRTSIRSRTRCDLKTRTKRRPSAEQAGRVDRARCRQQPNNDESELHDHLRDAANIESRRSATKPSRQAKTVISAGI